MHYYKCIKCYQFKTKIISVNNMERKENIRFTECIPVMNHLKKNDYCKIWFCKSEVLPTIYTTEHTIINLNTPTCPCYEGEEL